MMEIKRKIFVILSCTLLATQRSLATVSGLMAVWDLTGHLMPFFAVGHLGSRLPSGCLALFLTTQCPDRIGRKSLKTIDAPWKSAISGMIIPLSALSSLAVQFGCCVNVCRAVELELLALSHKKNEIQPNLTSN